MNTHCIPVKENGIINLIIIFLCCFLAGLFIAACSKIFKPDETLIIDSVRAGDNETLRQLLQKMPDLNYITETDTFPLLEASCAGSVEFVDLLLNNGANINLTNRSGITALMGAVSNNHQPVVACLIRNNADLSLTNEMHYSALHMAVERQNPDIIKLLLENGAPTRYSKAGDISLLVPAINNDSVSIAQFLIHHHVDPNAVNDEETPPLISAAKTVKRDIITLLLDNDADIHIKDVHGRDALSNIGGSDELLIIENIYSALGSVSEEVFFQCRDIGNGKRKIGFKELANKLKIANDNNLDAKRIKMLFDEVDCSFLSKDVSEQNLQTAVDQQKKNYIGIIELLIRYGADVNTTDNHQQSILNLIGSQRNIDILRLFNKKTIELAPDAEHRLHYISKGADDIQRAIMNFFVKRTDINLQDTYGNSPLISACANGNFDFALLLLQNGANVNMANNDGWTPLLNAVSIENFKLAELLLKHGADVDEANSFGETPLLKAVYRKNEKIAKLLLDSGADSRKANKNGDSPMSVAQKKGYLGLVKILE